MFLRECEYPVNQLKGAGVRTSKELSNLGILLIRDLLTHFPRAYEDRKTQLPLVKAMPEGKVNTVVKVIAHDWFGFGKKRTLKIWVEDDTARGSLLCFGRNFLKDMLKEGETYRLYGTFQYRYGELQSSSFEAEPVDKQGSQFGRILPLYPLSGSLNQGTLRRLMEQALEIYGLSLEGEIPERFLKLRDLMPVSLALQQLHFPESLDHAERARISFAYHELFFLQLLVARRSNARTAQKRRRPPLSPALGERLLERLPFQLTKDQEKTMGEIREDLIKPYPMARLLQGEVGSGKTLVAFLSCLIALGRGEQAAFMAPTELLARQHANTAARMLSPLGIRIALLTGTIPEPARRALLDSLKAGEIDLLLGTHALLSSPVEFRNLGLAVVDEQHRFGVNQRIALMEKGDTPDLLLLSATPIPRTLALTVFSDLSISTLKTLPKGRKPVETHLAVHGKEEKVYQWVEREFSQGRQAYFVYPLIEQSEKLNLKNAEGMYKSLKERVFPHRRLALIHSRLPEEEKFSTMEAFTRGEIDLLVSTSVVEVGVDIPNASCMVVEQAERFGLSALHQLRGRVGRGEYQSYAFFIYSPQLTEEAKRRLRVLMETSDGFVIAEEDLAIRGPGEITGIRQSGAFRFKAADLGRDREILELSREDAFSLVREDPGLLQPENKVLREVLRRAKPFEEEYLASG